MEGQQGDQEGKRKKGKIYCIIAKGDNTKENFWVLSFYSTSFNTASSTASQILLCRGMLGSNPEPVFLNVYWAPELIPRNEFRQPM